MPRTLAAWLPVAALPPAVWWGLPEACPPWVAMWALAFSIYAGCKWLTWVTARAPAPLWRHGAYLLGWPGMDAESFLAPKPRGASPPGPWLMAFALAKVLLGIGLTWIAVHPWTDSFALARGWTGMIGIVLLLHFGVFDVLSWAWRRLGVDAKPLMDRPLASVRLSELWGRRWNTAFRDLTSRFLFRPLASRLGGPWALMLGFAASGLVHDLVISLPAGGGYGGPTAYFVLQGTGILFERSALGRKLGLDAGARGRCFTLSVLILPVLLLFHPPFVRTVILPMLDVLAEAFCA